MPEPQFSWPVRVYYEDTDAGGVVYHANYLRYMERARNEWLRELGYPIVEVANNLNLIFVVRRVEIDYLAPARLDDLLHITAEVAETGRTSMQIHQQALKEGQCLVNATITLVTVDAQTFRPKRLPEFLLSTL